MLCKDKYDSFAGLIFHLFNSKNLILFFCLSVFITSCKTDPLIQCEPEYELMIPAGFDQPEIPLDNPFTAEKIALGKKLFYDKSLSIDSTVSCGNCHNQSLAFSDNVAISLGVNGTSGFRNAPTLANLAWAPVMLKDGGNPTLETQILIPLETHFEMGFNMLLLVQRLRNDPAYVEEFYNVFEKEIDPFGITRAIAAFERTMISGNSRYDQYQFQGDENALSESEKNGMNLFFSPALNCSSCHAGFLLTDNTFQNNGFFADYSADSGRARITWLHDDVGKFRVPSLRNIALTGPYMHDGSIVTLGEIIDRYASGGSGHENQSERIHSFTISAEEKNNLINFLNSLTDESFISNPDFKE